MDTKWTLSSKKDRVGLVISILWICIVGWFTLIDIEYDVIEHSRKEQFVVLGVIPVVGYYFWRFIRGDFTK